MRAVIDRFEGDMAVLVPVEGGSVINVPKNLLPTGAIPGDTMIKSENSWVSLPCDTAERKRRIAEKIKNLFIDD